MARLVHVEDLARSDGPDRARSRTHRDVRPAVASIDIHDISDLALLSRYYEILKVVAEVEDVNRRLLRLRSVKRPSWKTHEISVSE